MKPKPIGSHFISVRACVHYCVPVYVRVVEVTSLYVCTWSKLHSFITATAIIRWRLLNWRFERW